MDNLENPPEVQTQQPLPPPPAYPPRGEALLVFLTTLAATLMIGTATVNMGKVGLFLSEIFFLVPPLFYLHRRGFNIRRCLRWHSVPFTVIISTILIGIAMVVLLDEMDRLMNMIFPMPQAVQKALMGLFELKTWTDYLVVGLGVVLIAAFCEESLFRGFMQVSFEAHGNVTWAVSFTALLFAAAHFNPWWLVQILILGMFLGFMSWRSASTIPGMIVHGMNNGFALAAGSDTSGPGWGWYNMGGHVSPAILIGAMALLFMGFKFFIRATEKSFQEDIIPDETPIA